MWPSETYPLRRPFFILDRPLSRVSEIPARSVPVSDASDSGEILNKALDLIAGREHSAHELRRKLISRGYDTDAVDQQLQRMRQERLLCDARFTEAYVHRRVGAGVGPLKIRHELEQKGIETDLVQRFLDPLGDRWDEMMAARAPLRCHAAAGLQGAYEAGALFAK